MSYEALVYKLNGTCFCLQGKLYEGNQRAGLGAKTPDWKNIP